MILEYRLSNRQRWKYIFLPLMKLLAVMVMITIVGALWFDVRTDHLLFVAGFTWLWAFVMHFLPLLIMAVRHSRRSAGSSFAIDTVNNTYHYEEKDRSLSFRSDEIDKVIVVVSPPKYDQRMDISGFGYFFYWKIKLANDRTLSISCMLFDVDSFTGKELTREKQLFPIPPSNQGLWLPRDGKKG
ncbi:hypothetical protein D4L85_25075 [Chryseolinea soli]|uniref:PH domain-containing protein n=1 Tax=Chryseolinea soli TaxID=2321403 RepID=A0A385SRZ1_9BACT|nr:hypothetical protein D4L85_25075 [Chryseolinea soli]